MKVLSLKVKNYKQTKSVTASQQARQTGRRTEGRTDDGQCDP